MAIFVSARYGEAHTMEPEKGYLHVYTGNGKGKTTAAFGLALRALCAGKRVFVAQFVKSMQYNETAVAEHFDGIEIHQYGRGCFINRPAAPEDRAAAEAGWETCREVLRSDRFDVVILDELSIAFYYEYWMWIRCWPTSARAIRTSRWWLRDAMPRRPWWRPPIW